MNPGGFAPIMFSLWVSLYRILVRAEWVRLGCFRPGCISINPCFDVKRSTSATQRKLEEAWNRYDVGEISTGHFLRLCAVPSTCPASKCDGTVSLWSLCLCDSCDVIPLCWTACEMLTVTWMMLMLFTFIEFISFWKLNKINITIKPSIVICSY